MTETDVENYLWDVQSRLRSSKHRRGRIVEELRNHIEDGIVEYSSDGMPESEAAALVIEQLGPADQVAASFDTAHDHVSAGSARTSWLPVVIPVGWTVITLALLVRSMTWARSGWTLGEQIAQRQLLWASITGGIAVAIAYACTKRAATHRGWLIAAWACSPALLLHALLT